MLFRFHRDPSLHGDAPAIWSDTFGAQGHTLDVGRRSQLETEHEQRSLALFVAFMTMWLIVGLVAAYDSYLTVKYAASLHDLEQNLMARWIMGLKWRQPLRDMTPVASFLACKVAGTVLVLGVLTALYWHRQRLALTVAAALAAFQTSLAAYLLFA